MIVKRFGIGVERAYHRKCDLCKDLPEGPVGVSLMLHNGIKRTTEWTLCFEHARGLIEKLRNITPEPPTVTPEIRQKEEGIALETPKTLSPTRGQFPEIDPPISAKGAWEHD